MSPLISATDLDALLASGAPVRLLDVRWRLDRPEGRPDYVAGHLPGAVYVDLDRELSRRGEPQDGRHPLPAAADLEAAARRWGVRAGDTVVAYDDVQSVAAARAWWLLSRSGVADVRVLDGGLRAWTAAGLAIETGDVRHAAGDVQLHDIADGAIGLDAAAVWPDSGVLLDVRAAERYRGDTEPMDPRAGHIPGAVNLPTTLHLDGGRFRDLASIAASFAAAGAVPGTAVAAYCGSGVTAAHTALAGALAGLDIAVYPGSWSQWSNTRGRPVATGPTPSGRVEPD
ncbi:sulfurtransferase [Microbacterium thalassium]|uniref:Thiosulfate/3-mercaptopyruvate sulfurtransferase n=1 Tax=Microbacterium thalassium TaxID=362649 RepID=A0A7X0FSS8_9MICO|nr:sulfurtransferase [Microbacterium thalassium]MBB6392470.1 thiosulfate/3-mercaptopyruvate sulfurtransferase [Microbacterium thalassium]GLK23298.1 sulfurtransferase [Microbacterium thalassium]